MDYLNNETVLRNWLLGVASLRLLSVGLGYFSPMTLKSKVFEHASKQYTELVGRTFAVWTTVTCLITIMAALNLRNTTLLWTTVGTFAAANTFFALELMVYKTVSVRTIALPFFFASEWGRARVHCLVCGCAVFRIIQRCKATRRILTQ